MAPRDFDRDNEGGRYSRFREDEERQHRWAGGGHELDHDRGSQRSSDRGYSSERGWGPPRGSDMRGDDWQRRPDYGGRRRDWDWEENYNRTVDWNPRHSRDDYSGRNRDWDWDENYNRTVDWNPRRGHSASEMGRRERGWDWDEGSNRGSDWGPDRGRRSMAGGFGWADWARPGPFTGRGPRGYQRSDERIREDVCEILTRHGQIDATDIEVVVRQAEVTLRGTVDGRQAKRWAEDAVEDISGVREVRNELRVQQRDISPSSHTYTVGATSYQNIADEAARSSSRENRGFESSSSRMGDSGMSRSFGRDARSQLREGMDVVGNDGESIGTVKEISNNSFLVDRPMHRDVYVPFSAVRSVSGNRVMLDVEADDVDDQGWATPSLMGAMSGDSNSRDRHG